MASWWFGTFFIFPYIGNHNPNISQLTIFFRGVETTNQLLMLITVMLIIMVINMVIMVIIHELKSFMMVITSGLSSS